MHRPGQSASRMHTQGHKALLPSSGNPVNSVAALPRTARTTQSNVLLSFNFLRHARTGQKPVLKTLRQGQADNSPNQQMHRSSSKSSASTLLESRWQNPSLLRRGPRQSRRWLILAPSPIPGDDGSGLFSRTWIAGLRLVNPGNHCYANAAVCALLSVFTQYLDIPQGLRALHRVCWHASYRSQALTLKRQFAMRSCVPRWPFNGAQQDAVEFTGQLMEGVGWTSGRWEARSLQDGHIQCFETGYAPITLPVPAHAFALQDAIQAWHVKSHLHALTEASVLIFLQLGRHTGGAKNQTEADFQACVRMPVFLEGLDVQWVPYEVQSAILHYGDTPLSGHYRSQLRLSDSDHWYLTDDNVTAQLQQIQSPHRCNLYAVWIKKAPAQSSPSTAVP